jgi:hypothetical protein
MKDPVEDAVRGQAGPRKGVEAPLVATAHPKGEAPALLRTLVAVAKVEALEAEVQALKRAIETLKKASKKPWWRFWG